MKPVRAIQFNGNIEQFRQEAPEWVLKAFKRDLLKYDEKLRLMYICRSVGLIVAKKWILARDYLVELENGELSVMKAEEYNRRIKECQTF